MLGMYDFGADVETPLRANRGGEGGMSEPLPVAELSRSFMAEKGIAGQLCPVGLFHS